MKTVYALLWRQERGSPADFEMRTPGLLAWLRDLRRSGKLRGCGAWADRPGGLTLVEAESAEEAAEIARGDPMSELGPHDVVPWEVYYGDLKVEQTW